jgi:hypothetical protein
MRIACITAIVAILTSMLAGASLAAANPTRPALQLLRANPLTVKGVHFAPRARVRVTVQAAGKQQRVLTTTASGTFTARFPNLTADRCTTLEVQAIGPHHQTALLKTRPLCPPP